MYISKIKNDADSYDRSIYDARIGAINIDLDKITSVEELIKIKNKLEIALSRKKDLTISVHVQIDGTIRKLNDRTKIFLNSINEQIKLISKHSVRSKSDIETLEALYTYLQLIVILDHGILYQACRLRITSPGTVDPIYVNKIEAEKLLEKINELKKMIPQQPQDDKEKDEKDIEEMIWPRTELCLLKHQ